MFFDHADNLKIIGNFLRKAEAAHIQDEIRASRLSISHQIIGFIYKSPEEWDKRCGFNIKHVGNQFLQSLTDFDQSKPLSIDYIYVFAYRFLCEFDFLIGADMQLGMELAILKQRIQDDLAEMDSHLKSQMVYASYVMPANIAKEFINDSNIGVFKDFAKIKEAATTLRNQWSAELQAKEAVVNSLKAKLDEYAIAFNFVGLSKGFAELIIKKNKEALWLFVSLLAMGILILAPVIVEFVFALSMRSQLSSNVSYLYVVVPLVSLEIILIYFFRILLINFKSIKAQILQIELRQTLCQFIQSYITYSTEIKAKDATALEKFENIIFSGVSTDPENLPTTFDGINQIGEFIKKLRE